MIPSDHFVRFYNEVFKFLDARGALPDFYAEISRHQEKHCLAEFREQGLRGVHHYYQKIVREENCECVNEWDGEHCLVLKMTRCPSLSKAMDNDAGVCPKYCDHCPGWTMPLYTKAGLYQIYHVMGHDRPQCCEWIFDDLTAARRKYAELVRTVSPEDLLTNFQPSSLPG